MAMIVGLTEAATAGDARAAKVILEMLGTTGTTHRPAKGRDYWRDR